jgi:hypothetical protein
MGEKLITSYVIICTKNAFSHFLTHSKYVNTVIEYPFIKNIKKLFFKVYSVGGAKFGGN